MIYFLKGPNYDYEHIRETYLKYARPKFIALEIGASTVFQTKEFALPVKKLIGVEYFSSRLPKNIANIEYRLGDWQKLSQIIDTNSIDLAVSTHTLEHVKNDLKAVNELYKVLKPNGVAILNTPNRERLTRRIIEIFTGPRIFPFWEHVREYNYTDLFALLTKSKFKNFQINPVLFGIHAGKYKFYNTSVPPLFFHYANYWEILLFKSIKSHP